MITKYFTFTGIVALFLLMQISITAQENISGVVYYKQMDKIEFEATGRAEFDQWARTMPTEYTFEKLMYFDEKKSLFEDSPNPTAEPMSRRERHYYFRSKYGRKPMATIKKLYSDYEKNEITELRDFMTREFRIESEISIQGWKMTNEFKSILGYTCMGAEMTDGEDQIIAYFTPEIPIPGGPDAYHGLPGLILAIEKNGYTTYLAAKIEMKSVEEFLVKPNSGKKVTQEELDEIIEEKIEEFKEERQGGGRHGGRRH